LSETIDRDRLLIA